MARRPRLRSSQAGHTCVVYRISDCIARFIRCFPMANDTLDLDRYCRRIGLTEANGPSLDLLQAIVARHSASIPFENLDIVLGRPIRLDIGSLQSKLVDSRRGGYCFEQNTLLR